MTTTAPISYPHTEPLGEWSRHPDRGCVQPHVNREIFFPRPGLGTIDTTAAKNVCRRCPVRVDCGNEALAHKWIRGVWGATTPAERREMRRRGLTAEDPIELEAVDE